MANATTDNTTFPAGDGSGNVFADDYVTSGPALGTHVPRIKAGWGTDGAYNDPTPATPLPTGRYETTASGTLTNSGDSIICVTSFGASKLGISVAAANTGAANVQLLGSRDNGATFTLNLGYYTINAGAFEQDISLPSVTHVKLVANGAPTASVPVQMIASGGSMLPSTQAVSVSNTVSVQQTPNALAYDNLSATGTSTPVALPTGMGAAVINVTQVTGASSAFVELSNDYGSSWFPANVRADGAEKPQVVMTAVGRYRFNVAGWNRWRLNGTIASGGAFNTVRTASVATPAIDVDAPLALAGVGYMADAAATSDTGTFSLLALIKRLVAKFPAAIGGASSANSLPVVLANDQVGVVDTMVVGAAGQTAAGNNVLLATAATGWLDTLNFRSFSAQLIPTGTISAGQITFEGSNDGATPVGTYVVDLNSSLGLALTNYALATGVSRLFGGPLNYRYLRARISVAITGGGSVAAVTKLSAAAFNNPFVSQGNISTVSSVTSATLAASAALVGDVGAYARASVNGASLLRITAAASTNATSVKSTPGRVTRITLFNTDTSVHWVKFYNLAAAPTVGTSTVMFALPIAAGGGIDIDPDDLGIFFSAGIALSLGNSNSDSDTAAIGTAGVVVGFIQYA